MAEHSRIRLLRFKALFKNTREESNYTDLCHSQNDNSENKTEFVYDNLNNETSDYENTRIGSGSVPRNGQDKHEGENRLTFHAKTNTGRKIVITVVACVLFVAAVATAVYFSTTKSEAKDGQPQKGEVDTRTQSLNASTVATATDTSTMKTTRTTTEGEVDTRTQSLNASTVTTATDTSTMKTPRTTTEDTSIGLSEWGEWSPCTATCGSGIQRRYRTCYNSTQTCSGNYLQTRVCNMKTCQVNGIWTTWYSWLSCDVTCGGGQQTRYRECKKRMETDIDCVGKGWQTRNCSTWKCPDCSRTCAIGKLNDACDACICETNIVEGRITSLKTGAPLFEAEILDAELPVKVLGRTGKDGRFTLEAVCTTSKLLVKSTGFVETVIEIDEAYMDISLPRIVRPYFIETPQSKSRLVGENVTLCCAAKANPPITSYEWFHDSKELDESLYPNGTHLHMTKLNKNDSGEYKCRANSPAGAMVSSVATLRIHEEPDDFCSNSRLEKTVILPSGCETDFYDVGKCSPIGCRQTGRNESGTCREKTRSCCKATATQLRTVKCSGFDQDIFVVMSCGCRSCGIRSLTIAGVAVGLDDGSPIKYGEIWVNGDLTTYTNGKGKFKFSPSMETNEIVVTVKAKEFIDALKVILLSDDMTGTVEVLIRMFKITVYNEVDSSTENTITTGTTTDNSSTPRAELTIPANAFMYPDGTSYNGTVCACLTFLDPTNISYLPDIPGQFRTISEEGDQERLASFGLFSIKFEDNLGNDLVSNDIVDVSIPTSAGDNVLSKDMKLWTLNLMGEWEEIILPENHRRKKRQIAQSAKWIGGIKLDEIKYEWINLDYRAASVKNYDCFYKVRVYENDTLANEIVNPQYGISADFHSYDGDILKTYGNAVLEDPSNECFPGYCDGTIGFITVFYRLNYFWQSSVQKLYFGNITTSRTLDYMITDNKAVLNITATVHNDGPFYADKAKCRASLITDSHLRVYFRKFPVRNYVTYEHCNYFEDCHDNNYEGKKCRSAWYPNMAHSLDDDVSYGVCLVKIRVEFAPGTSAYHHNIKLRASSYGGDNFPPETKLGVREYELTKDNTDILSNTSLCVEYKCSGNLEPEACNGAKDIRDHTRVEIVVDVPKILIRCEVMSESNNLIEQSKEYSDSYTSQVGNAEFVFHAHDEDGSGLGLYAKYDIADPPSFVDDVETKQPSLYNYCKAGETNGETKDHKGVAATFYCKQLD